MPKETSFPMMAWMRRGSISSNMSLSSSSGSWAVSGTPGCFVGHASMAQRSVAKGNPAVVALD